MEPLPALSQQEMISKIKFVFTPCISFQPTLDQLKNGAIYLQIVSHFHPNIIDTAKINFKGASLWEAFQSFEVLSRVLEGEGIPFAFDIQKLALPNLHEHFRLSCFLFEALQKGKGRADGETAVQPDPRSIQVLPPRNAKAMLLQKNLNAHISLAELECLHSKRALKEIECSIHQSIDSNNQLEDYEQTSNLRDNSQKNFIIMNLSKAKQLNETYYNTFKIAQKSQLNFYSFLRYTTLNFLKNTKTPPLRPNQQQAISQCLSIRKSFRSINCLFYGINKNYPQTQQSLLARQNIRKRCRDYYRSVGFIRTIVQNDLRKMKFKVMTVAYLHKFQMLTQRQLTKKQFEGINKQQILTYFQPNFSVDDGIITNSITPEMHLSQTFFTGQKPQSPIFCTLEEKKQNKIQNLQQSTEFQSIQSHQADELNCQSNNNQDFSLNESNSDENQYWTIHKITLIAYELQYVHKKDPFYIEDDEFFYKRSDHSKFTTGFLFTCRMGGKRENIQYLLRAALQSRKYPRLLELFGKEGKSSEGSKRLREFVTIMLSLKHPTMLHEFATAYDAIIAEIDAVSFAQVKAQKSRFDVINKITQKLRVNAAEIDRVLREMLSLSEGDAISVLRATVYCFLAEKFVFHTNELWAEAFSKDPKSKDGKQ